MRPYGFDEVELLRYARAHAEHLKEEWRLANHPKAGGRPLRRRPGAAARARRAAGGALIEVGRLLLRGRAGSRSLAVPAHRPDGC